MVLFVGSVVSGVETEDEIAVGGRRIWVIVVGFMVFGVRSYLRICVEGKVFLLSIFYPVGQVGTRLSDLF